MEIVTTVSPVNVWAHQGEVFSELVIGHHIWVGISKSVVELDHRLEPGDRVVSSWTGIANDLLVDIDSSECVGWFIFTFEC